MHAFLFGIAWVALAASSASAQMAAAQDRSPTQKSADAAVDDQPSPKPLEKAAAPLKLPPAKIAPNVPLTARERASQMLNRFSYGPRPGEVERVLAEGPDRWFEEQLHPDSIPDPLLGRRLNDYPTLNMRPEQILAVYPDRNAVAQIADGKLPYPADPLLASVYQVQVYKYLAEQQDKLHPKVDPSEPEGAAQKKLDQATAARVAGVLFALPKNERMAALDAMPVPDRIAFANLAPNPQRNTLLGEFNPRERETISAMQNGVGSTYRILDELAQAKLVRSILSERQLQEVLTDFWFNHFNIFAPKDADQWYTTGYERDAIRPHALGKFRDLLLATAQSPAMMIYLDNWLSIGPDSVANGVDPARPKAKKGNRGLNENYGREVMELHTVGVNGGYTQADVTQLAAILTGWSVNRPNKAGPFLYDAGKHEPGPKDWFGYTIAEDGTILAAPAGASRVVSIPPNTPVGMRQGVAALTLLAGFPQTAHFISYLIAQRFLADNPPTGLVDRMAATWLASDGDIAAVLRTLVSSREFNSHRYFRNQVKTPLEFVTSAFRATATDPQNPGSLVALLGRDLGQPLYKALPPTGYYITADIWMNTQSLLARLNFADQLTHNRFSNQKFDSSRVLALSLMNDRQALVHAAGPARGSSPRPLPVSAAADTLPSSPVGSSIALHVLEGSLVGGEISPTTDSFIRGQMAQQPTGDPTDTLNLLTALLLGSPEFQLH